MDSAYLGHGYVLIAKISIYTKINNNGIGFSSHRWHLDVAWLVINGEINGM